MSKSPVKSQKVEIYLQQNLDNGLHPEGDKLLKIIRNAW